MITNFKSGDKVHIRWRGNSGHIYDWNCVLVSMKFDDRVKCNILTVMQYSGDRFTVNHQFHTNIPVTMIISIESVEDWDLGI